jgi:hypothetical protein
MLPTMSTFSHMQFHTCHKIHLSTRWNMHKSTSIRGGIAHIEQTDAEFTFPEMAVMESKSIPYQPPTNNLSTL